MKHLLTTLIILLSVQTRAQFALIESKDGFAYVRETPEIGNNIIEKLSNGEIIMVDEIEYSPEQTWFYVKLIEEKAGYIHKSGVKFIHSLTKGNLNLSTENSSLISTDECVLNVSSQKFNSKKYKITYKKNNTPNSEQVLKINGKEFWGTDYGLPTTVYNKVFIKLKGKTINLPIDGLFNPNLKATNMYVDKTTDRIYIIAKNGDGAGSYSTIWLIEKGKFSKRIVIKIA